MDEKFLIANSLVPDNEVWVSPKTFENPFSRNIKEALPTSAQQLKPKMPSESDFMAWCAINHYNQAEAASIYRYIARHFGR